MSALAKWQKVREQWFKEHPAEHYICYLCGHWLTPQATTLDHVIPRSNARNYASRHDFSNLKPACWSCNVSKGSKHL